MHQTLRIPEILLNIFGHCSTPTGLLPGKHSDKADLAVLARTCQTFREPALDVLWEELYDISPLARCLPEACRLAEPTGEPHYKLWPNEPCYLFSRPLKEVEWKILRGYTSRIRFIYGVSKYVREDTIREILSAPLDDPLFPHLRSLYWDCTTTLSPLHVAVPSLTTLHFGPYRLPPLFAMEIVDAFGDRCPHIENLVVDTYYAKLDSTISRVVCRWPKLQEVVCSNVALSMDAISHLSSVSNLRRLEFRAEMGIIQDISHLDSKLVFSDLTSLNIRSGSLYTVILLLRYIRLPAIETLYVATELVSRRVIQAYWTAVREACPSNVLTCFQLRGTIQGRGEGGVPLDEPVLTVQDLRPCTAFSELREFFFDFDCPISLTDADLLELVSPRMEKFLINYERGWQINRGGITLDGLVQLLRQCPLLNYFCLAIDTQTFTKIPEGLDVSFPVRRLLEINFLDSYIWPESIPGVISVFATLGLDPSILKVSQMDQWSVRRGIFQTLWEGVLSELRSAC